jgi:cellulose biosynthesis protein BcsQ
MKPITIKRAKRVLFWAFRGGVGVSTLVANVAYQLALMGKKVWAVDFDFDSPGLELLFGISPNQRGIIDYLGFEQSPTLDEELHEKKPTINDIVQIISLPSLQNSHLMVTIVGGCDNDERVGRLKQCVMDSRYEIAENKFLDHLFTTVERKYDLDYILIDLRHGYSFNVGLAGKVLNQTCDLLVAVTDVNCRNVTATIEAVGKIKEALKMEELEVLPIVSKVQGSFREIACYRRKLSGLSKSGKVAAIRYFDERSWNYRVAKARAYNIVAKLVMS